MTTIGNSAFALDPTLKTVVIPSNIISIEEGAFWQCSSLINVYYLGCSSPNIGINVFTGTQVSVIKVKSGCGNISFDSKTITPMSESTTGQIKYFLDTITGMMVFYGNGSTESTYAISSSPETNAPWLQNRNSIRNIIFENGVTSIGSNAFHCFYTVDNWGYPNIINVKISKTVETIGDKIFEHATLLKRVEIQDGVKTMGNKIFYQCVSLTKITIPKDITSLKENIFYNCNSLQNIVLPENLKTIEENAFYQNSITSIRIPDSVTTIGNYAFYNCERVTELIIGKGLKTIGEYVFPGCKSMKYIYVDPDNKYFSSDSNGILYDKHHRTLIQYPLASPSTKLTIPNTVITLGPDSLKLTQFLTTIIVPDSVKTIQNFAFSVSAALTTVTIGNGLTTIGNRAFDSCTKLTTFTVGTGITSIGEYAFSSCTSLTTITIKNKSSFGHYAFTGCTNIQTFYFYSQTEPWYGAYVFSTQGFTVYIGTNYNGPTDQFCGKPVSLSYTLNV